MAWVQLLHPLGFRAAMQFQPNSTSNSDSNHSRTQRGWTDILLPESLHRIQTVQDSPKSILLPFPLNYRSRARANSILIKVLAQNFYSKCLLQDLPCEDEGRIQLNWRPAEKRLEQSNRLPVRSEFAGVGTFVLSNVNLFKKYIRTWAWCVRVRDSGERAERDGSVRRARVGAEDRAGKNGSARGRSRVTRAARVNSARGALDARGSGIRARTERVRDRDLPRLGVSCCCPRAHPTCQARKQARLCTAPQLAADPACIRHPRRVRGWDAHAHAHARPRHPRRVRSNSAPDAAAHASPRTGMQGSRARNRLLLLSGCAHTAHPAARLRPRAPEGRRRTGVGKATGKRRCAHIQAPQPKTSGKDGMGWD
ncbi:hypothetical protein C8F04DRAFT_1195183 [Mycena alexandri]|uniref:Uncharacterized protein n=1 Tax=Mycena alexandri TaxID=1745969 RepID=A0AAD6WQR7_9AGAR|nr:hypothetical protein C8F04DRAFT_1195183 [Mycena alexandri]